MKVDLLGEEKGGVMLVGGKEREGKKKNDAFHVEVRLHTEQTVDSTSEINKTTYWIRGT